MRERRAAAIRERATPVAQAQPKADSISTVGERLPTPLYHQIYLVLRNKIVDGKFADGDILPSEEETARSCGVPRITTKRAPNELAEDGLVVRERGRRPTAPMPGCHPARPHLFPGTRVFMPQGEEL